jgi:transposase
MLDAIANGQHDPEVLAELACGRLRKKLPELRLALSGRVQPSHCFLLKRLLSHLDFLDRSIETVHQEIEEHLKGFSEAMTLIGTLPIQLQAGAAVVIAEIGVDMTRFPSASHIASWAGVCPGNYESAGKRLSGRTTKGNPYLRAVLCEMALIVSRMKDTYLSAFYHRIARRRGHKRAIIAVAHKLLVIIYSMLKNKKPYQELGADHFDQLDPKRAERRAVARLEQLGYKVTLARPEQNDDQSSPPVPDQRDAQKSSPPVPDQRGSQKTTDQKATKRTQKVTKTRKALVRKVPTKQALTPV